MSEPRVSPGPGAPNGWDNGRVTNKRGRGLRITGNILLTAGFVIAAYVAWLLWGTGLYTARVQEGLRQDVGTRIDAPRPVPPEGQVAVPGAGIAILRIPAIDLDTIVIEGTAVTDLKKGPGHYADTSYPWENTGRVGIAGHRTTYGAPFWSLNEVRVGDLTILETEFGTFTYRVTETREVLPTQVGVLKQTEKPTLVLTTCSPRFSAARRLIVFAERVSSRT